MQDEEMKIMITDTLPATFRSMQAGAARPTIISQNDLSM